jgi:hypothetical protein
VSHLIRHAVLKPVQLHSEPGAWAIEIEEIVNDRMLAPELESGKTACPESVP